jgi:hypothetical protein
VTPLKLAARALALAAIASCFVAGCEKPVEETAAPKLDPSQKSDVKPLAGSGQSSNAPADAPRSREEQMKRALSDPRMTPEMRAKMEEMMKKGGASGAPGR